MLTKDQIATFLARIMLDRNLRMDKTLLAQICEQAMNAVDWQPAAACPADAIARLFPAPTQGFNSLEEAIAAFEEATGFILPRPESPQPLIQEGSSDPVALDGLSIEEMLDSPLTDVPTNGTVVAGGNPPCDTKTQKSTPPSSPKAKTTHK